MQRRDNNSYFIITLLLPFVGLIYALSRWREPWAKNAFWWACIYLGAIFIFCPVGTVLGTGGDGGRYVLELMAYHNSQTDLISMISYERQIGGSLDYYQLLVTFIISRFTDNGHVLFAVFAFVFGFFYSRNIWYVLERLPYKKLGNLAILVSLFFLVCPITQINGVRMWTALHVYVYAMMPYLFEKDKSKVWFLVLVPFIHFSYLYVSIIGLVYVLLSVKYKVGNGFVLRLLWMFFIITMFINSINLDAVSSVMEEMAPDSYQNRIGMYLDDEVLDSNKEVASQANWYITLSGLIKTWSYNILLILILPCLRRNIQKNSYLTNIYAFTLLLGGIANIMALVPSGGRFQTLTAMFKIPLILLVVMSIPKSDRFRTAVNISLPVLLLPLVVDFRRLLDFYGISLLLGNFITVLFWDDNFPIIDFIKMIIS